MKVFSTLGILCLFAFSGAIADAEDKYCCNLKKHASQVLAYQKCITFPELASEHAQKIYNRIEKTHAEDLKKESIRKFIATQIKAKAMSEASRECIGSSPVFRNVHTVLDQVHALLEHYPGQANILKQISQAMEFMEQHFDELNSIIHGGSLTPATLDRIEHFIIEHIGTAVGIFEKNNLAAAIAVTLFNEIPLEPLINKLGDALGRALGMTMPSFQSIFQSRQEVRYAARDLSQKVAELHHMSTEKAVPSTDSIERMLLNFSADMKELRALIEAEKQAHKYKEP